MTIEQSKTPENSVLLNEWLDAHGIKAILFDLDDTLLDTYTVVANKRNEYAQNLHAVLPSIPLGELQKKAREADIEVFTTHYVRSSRWQAMAELLAQQYPKIPKSAFTAYVPILLEIYETIPQWLPGAEQTVKTFHNTKKKIGIVTHAPTPWSYTKLSATGLDQYVSHVEIADVDEFDTKQSSHWKHAIDALGIHPEEALVIGDSVNGDIKAALAAGVKHAVLLNSPVAFYAVGDVPEGVMKSDRIGTVINTILSST